MPLTNMKESSNGQKPSEAHKQSRTIQKRAGLTQEGLSVKAEVSRKSINAIENGIYVPSTVLALKISKTLNCTVEDLFQLP